MRARLRRLLPSIAPNKTHQLLWKVSISCKPLEQQGCKRTLDSGKHVDQKLHSHILNLCQQGLLQPALLCLQDLPSPASHNVYLSLLNACRRKKSLPYTLGLLTHLLIHSLEFVGFLGDHSVVALVKCAALDDALHIFCRLPFRTSFSWTAIISGFTDCGHNHEALHMYVHMQNDKVDPDPYTFVSLFKACGNINDLEVGRLLHATSRRKGFASDTHAVTTMVSMYGKCGAITEAEHAFNALSQCTIVTWTALITAYVEQSEGKKALEVYKQMLKQGAIFNHVTLTSVLQACSDTGSIESCKKLHFDIVSAGCDQAPSLCATLMRTYGSCVSMVDAYAFFITLENPGTVIRNACISGLAEAGNFTKVLDMFEELKAAGLTPDEVTFTVVLSACSQIGLVGKGLEYFYSMSRDYGLTPDLRHYGSLLDLLGRIGDFERVEMVLSQMPMQADLHIWLGLLCACCTYGNFELAKHVYDNAVSLQPQEAHLYGLMSKMYADAGLLELSPCKYPDI